MRSKQLKVALVCDWLTNVGGAEKVLLAIHQMYPDAPIYTSQYRPRGIDWFNDANVRTGWMQVFPAGLRRFLAPLRQSYFKRLDLSNYDLVISVTGAEAKSVKCGPGTTHICYCHVPTQYYWQMYDDYVKNPGFGRILNPLVRIAFKLFVRPLRKADYRAAQRPTQFVTISQYAAEMIKKYYGRDAIVVAPPVETDKFDKVKFSKNREGFINFSRQVSWKRQDLAVRACLKTGKRLTLIGDGPEHENLMRLARGSKLIRFLPSMDIDGLRKQLASAEGFIFPSIEPFGIAPVEALAAGCPVIALGQGGALDYIQPGVNGELFEKQNTRSLATVLEAFDYQRYSPADIVKTTTSFSVDNFKTKLQKVIDEKMAR